jgi:hypothetical protein
MPSKRTTKPRGLITLEDLLSKGYFPRGLSSLVVGKRAKNKRRVEFWETGQVAVPDMASARTDLLDASGDFATKRSSDDSRPGGPLLDRPLPLCKTGDTAPPSPRILLIAAVAAAFASKKRFRHDPASSCPRDASRIPLFVIRHTLCKFARPIRKRLLPTPNATQSRYR